MTIMPVALFDAAPSAAVAPGLDSGVAVPAGNANSRFAALLLANGLPAPPPTLPATLPAPLPAPSDVAPPAGHTASDPASGAPVSAVEVSPAPDLDDTLELAPIGMPLTHIAPAPSRVPVPVGVAAPTFAAIGTRYITGLSPDLRSGDASAPQAGSSQGEVDDCEAGDVDAASRARIDAAGRTKRAGPDATLTVQLYPVGVADLPVTPGLASAVPVVAANVLDSAGSAQAASAQAASSQTGSAAPRVTPLMNVAAETLASPVAAMANSAGAAAPAHDATPPPPPRPAGVSAVVARASSTPDSTALPVAAVVATDTDRPPAAVMRPLGIADPVAVDPAAGHAAPDKVGPSTAVAAASMRGGGTDTPPDVATIQATSTAPLAAARAPAPVQLQGLASEPVAAPLRRAPAREAHGPTLSPTSETAVMVTALPTVGAVNAPGAPVGSVGSRSPLHPASEAAAPVETEALGAVAIAVERRDQAINVHFTVDRGSTADTLRDAARLLDTALVATGSRLDQLQVDVRSPDSRGAAAAFDGSAQRQPRRDPQLAESPDAARPAPAPQHQRHSTTQDRFA